MSATKDNSVVYGGGFATPGMTVPGSLDPSLEVRPVGGTPVSKWMRCLSGRALDEDDSDCEDDSGVGHDHRRTEVFGAPEKPTDKSNKTTDQDTVASGSTVDDAVKEDADTKIPSPGTLASALRTECTAAADEKTDGTTATATVPAPVDNTPEVKKHVSSLLMRAFVLVVVAAAVVLSCGSYACIRRQGMTMADVKARFVRSTPVITPEPSVVVVDEDETPSVRRAKTKKAKGRISLRRKIAGIFQRRPKKATTA